MKAACLRDFPRIHLLLVLVGIGIVYATILRGMFGVWYNDANYSHGFLVPLVSCYFLSRNWDEVISSPVRPSNAGLAVFFCGLVLLLLGYLGTEYFTMRVSLIVLVAGIVSYWFGWRILRLVSLPITFLLFMIPLPYIVYDSIALPLKLLVAKASVAILQILAVPVVREGNIIMFPETTLEVADACSGLRSLMSLVTLAVALAFIAQKTPMKRAILIVSSVPAAIVTNMIRVVVTGVLASRFGAAAANGFFHEFAGMTIFTLAMLILFGESLILRKLGR